MNKIYGTYRVSFYNKGEGEYYPSFRLDEQYADYKAAGLTNTIDRSIPKERYTSEIAPGIKKQTRFIIGEYNPTHINVDDYKANIANVGAEFQIDIFATVEEARQWVRDNTDLVETETNKFLISEASDIEGDSHPAQYLIIE